MLQCTSIQNLSFAPNPTMPSQIIPFETVKNFSALKEGHILDYPRDRNKWITSRNLSVVSHPSPLQKASLAHLPSEVTGTLAYKLGHFTYSMLWKIGSVSVMFHFIFVKFTNVLCISFPNMGAICYLIY